MKHLALLKGITAISVSPKCAVVIQVKYHQTIARKMFMFQVCHEYQVDFITLPTAVVFVLKLTRYQILEKVMLTGLKISYFKTFLLFRC